MTRWGQKLPTYPRSPTLLYATHHAFIHAFIPLHSSPSDLPTTPHPPNTAQADAGESVVGRGAALIFLPGVAEIRKLSTELARCPGASRWSLLPLHGELPAAEQRRVFGRPPSGLRKVGDVTVCNGSM